MIPFNCTNCGQGLSAAEKQAGKTAKCPHCGASVVVPGPAASLRKEAAEAIYGKAPARDEPAVDLRRDGPPAPSQRLAASGIHPASARPASPRVHAVEPPSYGGVTFIGSLFCVLGALRWGVGAIVLLVLVAAAVKSGDAWVAFAAGTTGLVIGVLLLVAGFVLVGLGQVFFCVRDLARNSFWLRRL